eukprot:1268408-Rhodomonas_salina.2
MATVCPRAGGPSHRDRGRSDRDSRSGPESDVSRASLAVPVSRWREPERSQSSVTVAAEP